MRIATSRRSAGFTLIELMVTIGLIGLLMGLVLGVQRYAVSKSYRGRAEAEVAAIAAAAEAFKTEQAIYPRSAQTDLMSSLDANEADLTQSANAGLYVLLSGDADLDGISDAAQKKPNPAPVYMNFKASQLRINGGRVLYIRDPWDSGSSMMPYGYSTKRNARLAAGADDPTAGHNITFDLWSTAGKPEKPAAWITNW